ncbi:serine hydrolase [Nocardia cyriacigeorgica]|uniref:serine hydrolase n=2 Tax=Nocardia cyriacigeorgica TaxID=135487 RepID=UPI0005636EAD|nr:serine hydrolase [Nocardia cyriacigeorgica]AVH21539.1 serine hydrolase [Nocardia cyriacigeorgica]PPJ12403.1 serine hydrolase [Nocardia cyriacigeorgica]TLF60698.1 serine hydrolase [Nocardia cyriacigeorgica]
MRRLAMVVAAVIPLLAGCSNPSAADESCEPSPQAGVASAEEWLGRIHSDPDNISLAIDDGRGNVIERRADDQQPLASVVKVVHLAAYARAVAAGTLDPQETVPVSDWERWYLPGADGGAHPAARTRLTGATITLDQLVSAMIRESDNEWALARRYADDSAYRTTIQSKTMPPLDIQMAWAETTATGSSRQVASMHRAIATGSFGPGSDVARAHLEWQQPVPGPVAIGFKGGSYPGVLTDAIYLRRADGTVATAVLLNRRMPATTWFSALSTMSEQQLLVRAMTEPAMWHRLACAA